MELPSDSEIIDDDKEKFGKKTLVKYIQSNCDRQLFLELGKENPLWVNPLRELVKTLRPPPLPTKLRIIEGKEFEQNVYNRLKKHLSPIMHEDAKGDVRNTYLKKDQLINYSSKIHKENLPNLILLEHEFHTPPSFINWLFPLKNSQKNTEYEIVKYSNNRPDIIILTKIESKKELNNEKKYRELLIDGSIRFLTPEELNHRIAINVIDIKVADEENIGKIHFIEILYYLWNLTFLLHEEKLLKLFFVNIDGNGIFSQKSDTAIIDLEFLTIQTLLEYIIQLNWDDAHRLADFIFSKVRSLWFRAPCPIESIDVNIQTHCGICKYFQDCIRTLGKDGTQLAENWSLKLIPYTSSSIAQQLLEFGMKTIGDVHQKLPNLKLGTTPEPLHPELPLLNLKTTALIKDDIIIPNIGQSHTFALPRNTEINITFAAETDTMHKRVFAIGLLFSASTAPKSYYSLLFDEWWKIWQKVLQNKYNITQIQEMLQQFFPNVLTEEEINEFLARLEILKGLQIRLKGDLIKDVPAATTQITYMYSKVNQSLSNADEEVNLAKNFIIRLEALMKIASIIENAIVIQAPGGDYYYSPDTSIFYWASEQLANIQEMFERNLLRILEDPKIKVKFDRIVGMLTPSESEIEHPYRYMKLYNLQMFVETILGYPGIINCTWHDLASTQFSLKFYDRYWIPHFNYMDVDPWHMFLELKNEEKKKKYEDEIQKQIRIKVQTINRIRFYFQQNSRNVISRYSKPIKSESIQHRPMGIEYHLFAQIWYSYSKLSSAMDEWELDQIRTAYPEYAIGKMVAAEVDTMKKILTPEKEIIYHLLIRDLSSNMKISEGDYLLLLPDQMRDRRIGRWARIFTVTIASMNWDQIQNGYLLETEPHSSDLQEKAAEFVEGFLSNMKWFLYPTSMDAWTNKLYNSDGLLQKFNLGTSWLGHRLERIWEINKRKDEIAINQNTFNMCEIYFYYPQYFYHPSNPISKLPKELKTKIYPSPDKSQSNAIFGALDNVIYGIQGPPGTGKSQTIVALIDEFILSRSEESRILVTAFSYAAIYVLIDKIRKAKDKHDKLLPVANAQLIFVRTEGRDAIKNSPTLPFVNDLLRTNSSWKWNGKSREVTKTKKLDEKLESKCIIFANAHQLYHLSSRLEINFGFDLILVDEASQLPTDQFLASIQYCHNYELTRRMESQQNLKEINFDSKNSMDNLTKIVIVGDYNQLPPVQTVKPPEKLKPILDSLFTYYVRHHQIPNNQIQVNYRSHQDIVEYTAKLGIYQGLMAAPYNAKRILKGNLNLVTNESIKFILDPEKVVCSVFHERKYEIAISPVEAKLVKDIIIGYLQMNMPATAEEEIKFWQEGVGIVAPHNAQGRLIIHQLYQTLIKDGPLKTKLPQVQLMQLLKSTVYSVEKFQGSDRDLIIASVGISDFEQLRAEAEFIYDLNRFNVLTSRAKSKIIFICSESFLEYIPEDRQIMEYAAKMRYFAVDYCNTQKIIFPYNEHKYCEPVVFRWKSHEEQKEIMFPHLYIIESEDKNEITISHNAIPELIDKFKLIKGIKSLDNAQNESDEKIEEKRCFWKISKSILIANIIRIPLSYHANQIIPKIDELN